MTTYKTTTDLMTAAQTLVEQSESLSIEGLSDLERIMVLDEESHNIINHVNKFLATGYFVGSAYDELWMAKDGAYKASEILVNKEIQFMERYNK